MQTTKLVIVFALSITSAAHADVGVFAGTGQNLRQITIDSIQLSIIDVTVIPHRGASLFDGTVEGLDSVRYDCRFVLKNLTKKETEVKVGFPLDSGFAQNANTNSVLWVSEYDFIARDEKTTYHTTFEPKFVREGDFRYFALFTWNMCFGPREVKDLAVHYRLPMSMGLASTTKEGVPDKRDYRDSWMSLLECSLMEFAGYTTETGSSWAGNVEAANFKLITHGFEKYISQRGCWDEEVSGNAPQQKGMRPYTTIMRNPCEWHRDISPTGWIPTQFGVRWEHRNFKPKDPLTLRYYLLPIPRHAAAADQWIDDILSSVPEKKEHFKVLSQMEHVLLALYGQEPKDKEVLAFVSDQVWYKPQAKFERSKLTTDQEAILCKVVTRRDLAKPKE